MLNCNCQFYYIVTVILKMLKMKSSMLRMTDFIYLHDIITPEFNTADMNWVSPRVWTHCTYNIWQLALKKSRERLFLILLTAWLHSTSVEGYPIYISLHSSGLPTFACMMLWIMHHSLMKLHQQLLYVGISVRRSSIKK